MNIGVICSGEFAAGGRGVRPPQEGRRGPAGCMCAVECQTGRVPSAGRLAGKWNKQGGRLAHRESQ